MIRFSALNRQDSDTNSQSSRSDKSSQPTREAQEAAVLKLYHEAVKQQQEGHLNEAKSLYCDILCSQVVKADEAGVLKKIKFFIYKNLASIAKERNDIPTAVSAYIEASKIDDTDTLLWYQLAVSAGSLGDLIIMRKSLEQCLQCNNQYWPAIDLYFTVLLALKDYYACLQAILMALHLNPYYSKGLFILRHITRINPEFLYQEPQLRVYFDSNTVVPHTDKILLEVKELERKYQSLNQITLLPESISPDSKLKAMSITLLGRFLISTYQQCLKYSERTHQPSLTASVSLYHVLDDASIHDIKPENNTTSTGVSDIASPSKETGAGLERKRRLQFDSELLYLAPKRRSTRVKGKEKESQDYFQMIRDYLPPQLRLFDCPDLSQVTPLVTKSIDKDKESLVRTGSDHCSLVFSEAVIVKEFIEFHQDNNGIVHLLTEFLSILSSHIHQQWPKTGPQVYIDCYELIHSHLNYPSLFCEFTGTNDKNHADQLFMIALSYLELKVDVLCSKSSPPTPSSLSSCFNQCFLFVQYYPMKNKSSQIRVEWLRGKWAVLKQDKLMAIKCYQKCSGLLLSLKDDTTPMETDEHNELIIDSQPVDIALPNCDHDSIINEGAIGKKIQSLEQLLSLEKVQESFEKEEFECVVDILLPSLSEESYSKFFLGTLQATNSKGSSKRHGVQYLIDSLYNLNRYTDCYFYCVHFLIELLIHYQRDGSSDEWCKSLSYLYNTINKCTSSDSELFSNTDTRVTQLLVISIIKTLYAVQELVDTAHSSHLPTILPWKILHTVISFDSWASDDVEPIPSPLQSIIPVTPPPLQPPASPGTPPDLSQSPVTPPPLPPSIIPFPLLASSLTTSPDFISSSVSAPIPLTPTPTTPTPLTPIPTTPIPLTPIPLTPIPTTPTPATPTPLTPIPASPLFMTDTICSLDTTTLALPVPTATTCPPATTGILTTDDIPPITATVPFIIDDTAPIADNTAPMTDNTIPTADNTAPIVDNTVPIAGNTALTATSIPTTASTPPTFTTSTPPIIRSASLSISSTASPTITARPLPITTLSPTIRSPLVSPSISFSLQPLSAPPTIANVSPFATNSVSTAASVSKLVDPLSLTSRRDVGLCFLKLAHDQLGSYSWCCQDKGSFLLYIVSQLRSELKSLINLTPNLRELLLLELEQCYYCLYGYPSKKAKQKGLHEHNSEQIKIDWSAALMLMEYFRPIHIPTIDDVKSPDVTPELINLYKRMVEVVPNEGRVVSHDDLSEYIEGSKDELVTASPTEHTSQIAEMYYLLADDSLKLMENNKAIKYYQSTLGYSPDKFDSWAGLALAKSRKITERIDNRDLNNTQEKIVADNIRGTIRCFQKALEINDRHCYVVEKFGFFCYAMQAFASQIINLPQLYKSKGTLGWSEKLLPDNLRLAHDQFTHALSLEGVSLSEPWIYHFLLGKINWKLKKPLNEVLNHFVKSAETLHSEGAMYPVTVEVLSKGHAIQALEVHYHFMSVSLKSLLSLPTNDICGLSTTSQSTSVLSSIRDGISLLRFLPLGILHLTELWNWCRTILKTYYSKNNDVSTTASNTSVSVVEGMESTPIMSTGMSTATEVAASDNDVLHNNSVSVIKDARVAVSAFDADIPTVDNTAAMDVGAVDTTTATDLNTPDMDAGVMDKLSFDTGSINIELVLTPPPVSLPNYLLPSTAPLAHDLFPPFSSQPPAVCDNPVAEYATSDNNNELSSRMNDIDPFMECLYGVSMCAFKFPAYFKPLYRLANTLYQMDQPEEAKKFLLGPLPKCFASQEKLQPIFALKSNIFQNMWQLKVTEINRPGNFSSHARSCLQLLLQVLLSLNDLSSLLFIAQQLKSKPDQTKQYLRETERLIMYIKALHLSVQALKSLTADLGSMSECHKLLMHANTLKGLLLRAEGRKDESFKNSEQCMMKLFSKLWSDLQVRALFLKDGFSLPHEPTMELCLKYCSLSKDKDFAALGLIKQ